MSLIRFRDQGRNKRIYRFSNGKYFGVTQYLNLFSKDVSEHAVREAMELTALKEIKMFEEGVLDMVRREQQNQFQPGTVDNTKRGDRTKFFLGYRYDYGGGMIYVHEKRPKCLSTLISS